MIPEENKPVTARLHAVIDGMVQGVGFRMYVLDNARSIGVTGWVRNRYDGCVEVIAEGTHNQLERLIEKLRTGPRSAFVENLQKEWQTATNEFWNFEVRKNE